jgi:tRNA G10  N-methylase Trm11
MKQILISGSHPKLSLAEAISVIDPLARPHSDCAVMVSSAQVNIDRLGGFSKIGNVLFETKAKNFAAIEDQILSNLSSFIPPRDSKIPFGISFYGLKNSRQLNNLGMSIKKQLRALKISSRFVKPIKNELSSAQITNNRLLEKGFELLISFSPNSIIIGKTTAVQNFKAYGTRDYEKPCRDAKVGMLPPKLAQIMLNLATGLLRTGKNQSSTLLDPFCGSGTILQEALLAGYRVNGADIAGKMVACCLKNLSWLKTTIKSDIKIPEIKISDATKATFIQPIDLLVSEIYLGPPLNYLPAPDKLNSIAQEINSLLSKFLINLAKQIKTGTPICLAIPFWHTPQKDLHLPIIDQITTLGYNLIPIGTAKLTDLRYRRKDQLVGRQLLILKREANNVT